MSQIPRHESAHFIVLLPTRTRTFIWHIAPDGSIVSWTSAPISQEQAAAAVQETIATVRQRQPLTDAWRQFSRALVDPWLADIPEGATICFVPSHSTVELPFALLPADGGYLAERNPVSYLPSLSLLAYWLGSEPQRGVHRPLVLGDSRGDLRGARREAEDVARRLGTRAVLGADVVRSHIGAALADCDLLHVSCHARFDHASPDHSGFVLADGGIFSARDGAKLRLNAQLAVLSACESGRLDVKVGDELVGVASSLLSAGIRSIAATSWRIPDRATALLVDEFYADLLDRGAGIAAALRTAQRRLMAHDRYSHPYYWAAFRILGDWRNGFAGNAVTAG